MENFVQHGGWAFGAIGVLVGIIAVYMQITTARRQKQLEGPYRKIFDSVQLALEGQYTQQQIQDLIAQMEALRFQLGQVPNEARIEFLKSRWTSLGTAVAELFEEYNAVQIQIESTHIDLDPQIRRAIESAIMPTYLEQQHRQAGIYPLVLVVLVLSLFPIFGDFLWEAIYGSTQAVGLYIYPEDLLSYFAGVVLVVIGAYTFSLRRLTSLVSRNRMIFATATIGWLVVWAAMLEIVIFEPISLNDRQENLGAFVSLFRWELVSICPAF